MTSTVTLKELTQRGVAGELFGDASVVIRGVQHDSRSVKVGDAFVAIGGANVDGAKFASDAISRGAVAVISERKLELGVPELVVSDARLALSRAAAAAYGDPTSQLDVIGITGTNGKTTVSYLIEHALRHGAHASTALLGTVAQKGPGFSRVAEFTTPEGDDVARFAREVVDAGATHLVMEVSSHALSQKRVDAVHFRAAAFTNLSQDHLDFHITMEAYFQAKNRLFSDLAPRSMVVNIDDAYGARLAEQLGSSCLRVSLHADSGAQIFARSYESSRDGIRATFATPTGDVSLHSPLLGKHNVENLALAIGVGVALAVDMKSYAHALATAVGAPGRLERVPHPDDVAVFVDYAHTPDALVRALAALRPLTPGRLITVFGCGGDRDRTKRAVMGEAAALGSDIAIVTSDNPRTEDPHAILAEIEPGFAKHGIHEVSAHALRDGARGYTKIENRADAISFALSLAQHNDTVLIAGKGHEDYQIIGKTKHAFDDRDVAKRAIESLQRSAGARA